jgi:hypothetical protein
MIASTEATHVVAEVSRTAAVSVHVPYTSALPTDVAGFAPAFAVHAGSGLTSQDGLLPALRIGERLSDGLVFAAARQRRPRDRSSRKQV